MDNTSHDLFVRKRGVCQTSIVFRLANNYFYWIYRETKLRWKTDTVAAVLRDIPAIKTPSWHYSEKWNGFEYPPISLTPLSPSLNHLFYPPNTTRLVTLSPRTYNLNSSPIIKVASSGAYFNSNPHDWPAHLFLSFLCVIEKFSYFPLFVVLPESTWYAAAV